VSDREKRKKGRRRKKKKKRRTDQIGIENVEFLLFADKDDISLKEEENHHHKSGEHDGEEREEKARDRVVFEGSLNEDWALDDTLLST
jgi:hypothetical protein